MDISTLKPTERVVKIVHPSTGKELGISVVLMSVDDPRMAKVKRRITDRKLQLEARGKTFKTAELEENSNDIVFTAMTGWSWKAEDEQKDEKGNIIKEAIEQPTFRGSIPEFNRKNVFEVFNELEWFRAQLDEELGDSKAFFLHSEPN